MIKHQRAFTLVELLLVVAVSAVLLALLVPSLQQARETARRVKCLATARQVSLGCQTYMMDTGYMPSYLTTPDSVAPTDASPGGTYPSGPQHTLVTGQYVGSDAFTNRGCPEGPAKYDKGQGAFFYATAANPTVGIGINQLVQTGASYIRSGNATSYWTRTPGFYPNQGPFTMKHLRTQRRPDLLMVASCNIVPLVGRIPILHTMGITTSYQSNLPIPSRHQGMGLNWVYWDGHGKFESVRDLKLEMAYEPYKWSISSLYDAAGMD
jgi:prepilin-type N-terminal cleavage/methylation domain-containing protein/prepilin-type processing-associated H-X9-DG protein